MHRLSILLVAGLLFASGCDLFGSDSDGPAYVGTWMSETAGYESDDTVYLDITSDEVTEYIIGQTATGDPSCIETSASIANYDGGTNTMTLEVQGEQSEVSTEVQEDQLTWRGDTYMSTDVNPEEETPDVGCIQGNEVNSEPTFP